MKVELVYDATCPNAAATRAMLRGILSARGSADCLIEIDKDSASAPPYAALYASPTILLDGEDLFPTGTAGNACRIYVHEDGRRSGIPSRIAVEKMIDYLSAHGNFSSAQR